MLFGLYLSVQVVRVIGRKCVFVGLDGGCGVQACAWVVAARSVFGEFCWGATGFCVVGGESATGRGLVGHCWSCGRCRPGFVDCGVRAS